MSKIAEPKTVIGAEIRAERIRKGLSQKELADMVGVSVMTIHRLETGEVYPRKPMLDAIKAALMVHDNPAESDPFGCRDEILRFFAAAEDLIRALKNRP